MVIIPDKVDFELSDGFGVRMPAVKLVGEMGRRQLLFDGERLPLAVVGPVQASHDNAGVMTVTLTFVVESFESEQAPNSTVI